MAEGAAQEVARAHSETPSGQLGELDQSPAEDLEVSRQAGDEEEGRRAEWDLVPDSSHPSSSIRDMGGNEYQRQGAVRRDGGDGPGKAAPLKRRCRPYCLTRLTSPLTIN